MLKQYIEKIISAWLLTKKAEINRAYTGIFALQDINGVIKIVNLLSFSLSKVLVPKTAGTVQPNPISIGTNALPDKPIFLNNWSIIKAALAI